MYPEIGSEITIKWDGLSYVDDKGFAFLKFIPVDDINKKFPDFWKHLPTGSVDNVTQPTYYSKFNGFGDGCVNRKYCPNCDIWYVCDSSGTKNRDNIVYIDGPCCCGMWRCDRCGGNLKLTNENIN